METTIKTIEEIPIIFSKNNLYTTDVLGILEDDLSSCVSVIKESNPNVDIGFIHYSREMRKLSFYSSDLLSISKWEGIKSLENKSVLSAAVVLEELKKIIQFSNSVETNNNSFWENDTVIPLADVLNLVRQKNNEYSKMKDHYKELASEKYKEVAADSAYVYIRDFDYRNNRLNIAFSPYSMSNWICYSFYKKQGDLVAEKEDKYRSEEKGVIAISDIALKMYNEFEKYRDFAVQRSVNIPTINSRLIVNIDEYGVNLSTPTRFFSLCAKSYKDDYDYECTSNNIASTIKGNENLIFQNAYVRIKDCPLWMQADLYKKRTEAIEKEKQNKENMAKKEEKRQKKLEFKKKIWLFGKTKGEKNG